MVNYHASGTVGQGIVPASVDQIVAEPVISKAPVSSPLNLSTSNTKHQS
jgi:hypothetical protein